MPPEDAGAPGAGGAGPSAARAECVERPRGLPPRRAAPAPTPGGGPLSPLRYGTFFSPERDPGDNDLGVPRARRPRSGRCLPTPRRFPAAAAGGARTPPGSPAPSLRLTSEAAAGGLPRSLARRGRAPSRLPPESPRQGAAPLPHAGEPLRARAGAGARVEPHRVVSRRARRGV